MIDKKTFMKAIGLPLQSAGFVRKGQSWYLDGIDALIVINLQKSNWEDKYYINMGIWIKAFGIVSFPQFNHCPLYYRIESFFPEERGLINTGSSLGSTDIEILTEFTRFIESKLVPFLQSCTTISRLREMMAQGVLDRGFVRFDAREYLCET